MRTACLTLAAPLAALLAHSEGRAQTLTAPPIVAGDRWTYESTTEARAGWRQSRIALTVLRAGPEAIEISSQPVGSTMPPVTRLIGPDWSRVRSVDGHEQVVNRPLAFPMHVGESWVVDYSEHHPNRQHESEHVRSVYKVVGWEEISVPAGLFRALKIEAGGEWSAVLAPSVSAVAGTRLDEAGASTVMQTHRNTAAHVSGRTYKAFWYVPSVKRWVKSVEEYYDPNGIRVERYEDELLSFRPATG